MSMTGGAPSGCLCTGTAWSQFDAVKFKPEQFLPVLTSRTGSQGLCSWWILLLLQGILAMSGVLENNEFRR